VRIRLSLRRKKHLYIRTCTHTLCGVVIVRWDLLVCANETISHCNALQLPATHYVCRCIKPSLRCRAYILFWRVYFWEEKTFPRLRTCFVGNWASLPCEELGLPRKTRVETTISQTQYLYSFSYYTISPAVIIKATIVIL